MTAVDHSRGQTVIWSTFFVGTAVGAVATLQWGATGASYAIICAVGLLVPGPFKLWRRRRRGAATAPRELLPAETGVLSILVQRGCEMAGLELVKAGAGSRATIYVTLDRMEEAGLVSSRLAEGRSEFDESLPRRAYRPTELGLALLDAVERRRTMVPNA